MRNLAYKNVFLIGKINLTVEHLRILLPLGYQPKKINDSIPGFFKIVSQVEKERHCYSSSNAGFRGAEYYREGYKSGLSRECVVLRTNYQIRK
jgi:hypothetical protein